MDVCDTILGEIGEFNFMLNLKSKKVYCGIVSLCLLISNYLLTRYVFFDIHQMIQIPLAILVFDISVVIISFYFNARKTMVITSISYIFGFVIGILFESDYVLHVNDEGLETLGNTLWIWWLCVNLSVVLVGVVWEIIDALVKKLKI